MSADAWRICPKCRAEAETKRDLDIAFAVEQFGQMPVSEWRELDAKAHELLALKETFREDYELFMDEDGLFYLDYHGQCSVCGFKHVVKQNEQVL